MKLAVWSQARHQGDELVARRFGQFRLFVLRPAGSKTFEKDIGGSSVVKIT